MIDLKALAAPFPVNQIEWRVGSTNGEKTQGIALAYIDARLVMERLDAVCGVEGWQNKHPHANGKTSCAIGIKIGDEWVWKENGAGDSAVEAEKGAFSDSFKRAAVQWGIGRYLYDMPNIWVDLEPAGRSHKIKANQYAKLEAALNRLMTEKYGSEKDKNLSKAVSMAFDDEQNKQSHDYAVKYIAGCSDVQKVEAFMDKNKNKLNKLPKDLYEDVLQAASQQKTEILNKANGVQH